MSSRETILVTGGVGFVGSHFVRHAAAAGRRVIVLDDLSGGATPRPDPAIELIVGDIGSAALVGRVLREHRVGAIAHFAGKIQVGESVHRPELYFDVNLVRTLTLLEAARGEGVASFLFSSTAAVYGTPRRVPIAETARLAPVSPYGASKLAVEHALEAWGVAHGLRWAALRYFNAAGAHRDGTMREAHQPETHLIPLALDAALHRGPAVTLYGDDYDTPDGTCIRDYIHVEDLAAAHLAALATLERGDAVGAVNLGNGHGYSVREVMTVAGDAVGVCVPYAIGDRRPGDPPRLVADPSRALERLGWRARHSSLPEIIEDALRSRR